VKPAWRPSSAESAPLQQKITQSPAKKLELPAGYNATQIPAPTDPHGREQLFEPLGMVTANDGSLIVATRSAGVWTLKDNTWTQVAEGLLDVYQTQMVMESMITIRHSAKHFFLQQTIMNTFTAQLKEQMETTTSLST